MVSFHFCSFIKFLHYLCGIENQFIGDKVDGRNIMLNFEEKRITNEYELLCVVSNAKDVPAFSDELIELLYLDMKENFLPLEAFKHVTLNQEERLYIAYNSRLNRGKAEIIENEIRGFFNKMNVSNVIETGNRVKAMSPKGYKAVITNSSLLELSKRLHYQHDPYYKPYLMSMGLSDEDARNVLSKLELIEKYLWYRTKHKYVGVDNTSNNINILNFRK